MKARLGGLERFRHGHTRIVLPAAPGGGPEGAAVRAAVRAYIDRDSGPASAPHLNRFPAAPYCTLTWFLAGSVHAGPDAAAPVLPAVVVAGPFTRPLATFSAGRVHAFTIVFFPDAFARLTGLVPADLADRMLPARDVLPASWHVLLEEGAMAASDRERSGRIDAFLARPCRDAGLAPAPSWLARLRAAAGIGRLGERQVERNIRQATGQTLRALRCGERFEAALLSARAAAAQGSLDWAGLAGDSGYADQPHLSRECRKLTGASPADLIGRAESDESYWLFRHWK